MPMISSCENNVSPFTIYKKIMKFLCVYSVSHHENIHTPAPKAHNEGCWQPLHSFLRRLDASEA